MAATALTKRRNRCIEDEAPPRDRLQELVVLVVQRMAYFADALGQRVVSDEGVGPDCSKELLLGDQPAAVLLKVNEHLERLWPQPYLAPVVQQASAQAAAFPCCSSTADPA